MNKNGMLKLYTTGYHSLPLGTRAMEASITLLTKGKLYLSIASPFSVDLNSGDVSIAAPRNMLSGHVQSLSIENW